MRLSSGGSGEPDCPVLEEFTSTGSIPFRANSLIVGLQALSVIGVIFGAIEARNTGEADDFCKTEL